MSQVELNIDGYTYTVTQVATKLTVRCLSLDLYKSATFVVGFLEENGTLIKNEILRVEGEDYAKWGTDDSYIYTLIKERLLGDSVNILP